MPAQTTGSVDEEIERFKLERLNLSLAQAVKRCEALLELSRAQGGLKEVVHVMWMLADFVMHHEPGGQRALQLSVQAHSLAQQLGDQSLISDVLQKKAAILCQLGMHQQAAAAVEEVLEYFPLDSSPRRVRNLHKNIGCILMSAGQLEAAYSHLKTALMLPPELLANPIWRWNELYFIRCCAVKFGRASEAWDRLCEFERKIPRKQYAGSILNLYLDVRAEVLFMNDRLDEGLTAESTALSSNLPPSLQKNLLHTSASKLLDNGRLAEARGRIDAFFSLGLEINHEDQLDWLALRIRLAERQGDYAAAAQLSEQRTALLQRAETLHGEYLALALQAELEDLQCRSYLAKTAKEAEALGQRIDQCISALQARGIEPRSLLDELIDLYGRHSRQDSLLDLQELGFSLKFQPIVDLANGKAVAFEVELCLDHPQNGRLLPIEFIPRLEASGDIVEVGFWVIDTVCRMLGRLIQANGPVPAIAIDISARQLEAGGLAAFLGGRLKQFEVTGNHLQLEVTEATAVSEHAVIRSELDELRKLGVNFTIDRFGTGYCNYAKMIDFAPQAVKIDSSIVQRAPNSEREAKAVQSLVMTGLSLELTVMATGIDGPEILQSISSMGCHFGQGRCLGAAHSAEEQFHSANENLSSDQECNRTSIDE